MAKTMENKTNRGVNIVIVVMAGVALIIATIAIMVIIGVENDSTKIACQNLAYDKFDNIKSVEYVGEDDGYLVFSVQYSLDYFGTISVVQYCKKVGDRVVMGGLKN